MTVYQRDPSNGYVIDAACPINGWDTITKAEYEKAHRAYLIKEARNLCKPGTKVYGVVRNVSRSGMTRAISLFVAHKGEIRSLDYYMRELMGYHFDRNSGGVTVSGCGMDMVFHCVYSLSRTLYPKGHKTHKDGGYVLNYSTL